jgi:hypothetical protein
MPGFSRIKKLSILVNLLLILLIFTVCDDMPMGMGNSIDFSAPGIRIQSIVLPDGEEIPVEDEDNKFYVGPGILVGPGFYLKGIAWDNVSVEKIVVEEDNSDESFTSKASPWDKARIGARNAKGIQNWTISLDGIEPGERNLTITVYDQASINGLMNIGPETVKQLTLLIDVDPPFIESVKIERSPGILIDLLSRVKLEGMDPNEFDNIDYFQNETFKIRAQIFHDYSLSDVTLNFLDEDGVLVFDEGMQRTGNSRLHTPEWVLTPDLFHGIHDKYKSGRHYFKVTITARATAGHTNDEENKTNHLFNLCWYPEADFPRVEVEGHMISGTIERKQEIYPTKDGYIPVRIFDDDNVTEAYAAIVKKDIWDNQFLDTDDNEKIHLLKEHYARNILTNDGIVWTELDRTSRNSVLSVKSGNERGYYKLVVVARDEGDTDVWTCALFDARIKEVGEPIISVFTPQDNQSPAFSGDRQFTMSGRVLNIDPVDFLKVAWVTTNAAELNGWKTAKEQEDAVKIALINHSGGNDEYPVNGIKIWNIPLEEPTTEEGLDRFLIQNFSKVFNIFDDFYLTPADRLLNQPENEIKYFMLYTQGKAEDSDAKAPDEFIVIRALPFRAAPAIVLIKPDKGTDTHNLSAISGVSADYNMSFRVNAALPLTYVRMKLNDENEYFTPTNEGVIQIDGIDWDVFSTIVTNPTLDFTLRIEVEDELGNDAQVDVMIQVKSPPSFERFTSPHAANTTFSTNPGNREVTIQAVFNGPLNDVTGTPRLLLGNITNSGSPAIRYADYVTGRGSSTLSFVYTVQNGDTTRNGSNFDLDSFNNITVTGLNTAGGAINAYNLSAIGSTVTEIHEKPLRVDGVAPVISSITFIPKGPYAPWLKAGEELQVEVATNKALRVMGDPKLMLPFTSGTKYASFQGYKSGSGNKIMNFTYFIEEGDNTEIDTYAYNTSFNDASDITDTIGAAGNVLSLTGSTGTNTAANIRVDTIRPATLYLTQTSDPGELTFRTYSITNQTGGTPPVEIYTGTPARATVQYTLDGGASPWTDIPSPPYTGITANAPTGGGTQTFTIMAQQIDRAGNISELPDPITFQLGDTCDLVAVICDNPDGAYPKEQTLSFKLIFNGRIATGSTASMVIRDRSATATTKTINFTYTDSFTMTGTWLINEDIRMIPVEIVSINITGVTKESGGAVTTSTAAINTIRATYNDNRNVRVMAIAPTITAINGTAVTAAGNTSATATVLAPSTVTGITGESVLTLTLSHAVWPERGRIVIRPASGWHIPPVLSNEGYARVASAYSGTTIYPDNYDRTTQGLRNTAGVYTGEPDTATKYVLKFDRNLDTGDNTAAVRTALEEAKYLWQEIEVVSTSQVGTISGGTNMATWDFDSIDQEEGTATLRIKLDNLPAEWSQDGKLPAGRLWKIEIIGNGTNGSGAFRDEAGNELAQFGVGTDFLFWSQTVATPVIRVERVTNNRAHNGINPNNYPAAILQTGVRYRIDSETPGASIYYNTWNRGNAAANNSTNINNLRGIGTYGAARITTGTMPNQNGTDDPYIANPSSTDNISNSAITDATTGELTGITITTSGTTNQYNFTHTGTEATSFAWMDDNDMYTARKDYIASIATRSNLSNSARGYEGVFKTLIVYRNVGTTLGARFLKTEATTTLNGPVTIAGFPMTYNDMSGAGSKNLYRNGDANTADWIFISWEIVVDFWHVAMAVPRDPPNSSFTVGEDVWQAFNSDWYRHNYRKYGNWGLRVGNR